VDLGLIKRLRGEPTVCTGHHILAPDQLGEADEPFSNPFGMLDDVACMRDDARAQHFPFGEFHPLEQVIFVFMSRVRSLEAERAGIDLQYVFDDLWQVRFVDAGSFVYAVARVKANALGGNAAERRICRLNVSLRSPLLLFVVKPWLNKDVWQERIVHLHQNAGGGDRPVFLVELGSERVEIVFSVPVVLVNANARGRGCDVIVMSRSDKNV
jgi:hypothetical protein